MPIVAHVGLRHRNDRILMLTGTARGIYRTIRHLLIFMPGLIQKYWQSCTRLFLISSFPLIGSVDSRIPLCNVSHYKRDLLN